MTGPPKQKKDSTFLISQEMKGRQTEARRNLVKKANKTDQWIHIKRREEKIIDTLREGNAEVEAFAGDLYRLIIGTRQPKLRATQEGSIISKEIRGFMPLGFTNFQKRAVMSPREAVNKGIAAALVASFFLRETDFHPGNIGVNEKDDIVRIDFDFSLSLALRERYPFPISNILKLPTFPTFPKTKLPGPGGWTGWEDWEKCFAGLQGDKLFIKDKLKYCLKIFLLDQAIFAAIGQDHLSQSNMEVEQDVETRHLSLKAVLLQDPEFAKYFSKFHSNYWKEIEAEFKEYNLEIQKNFDKLERYIALVKAHPIDFSTLPELSKPKYQGLTRVELLGQLEKEQQGYADRLIDTDLMYTRFRDILKFTPLHEAAERGQLDVVMRLKEDLSVDVNHLSFTGATPLHVGAAHGHESVVKALLSDPRVDINKASLDGSTPLIAAAENGHIEVVKAFAESNLPGLNFHEALKVAVSNGHANLVRELADIIETSAETKSFNQDVNTTSDEVYEEFGEQGEPEEKMSLGCMAAEQGYADVVQALIEKDLIDDPYEVFDIAAEKGYLNVVRVLLPELDVNNALKEAVKMNKANTVVALLLGNLEREAVNVALTKAVKNGYPDVVKAFLESGRNDLDVKKIFEMAVTNENPNFRVIQAFLESKRDDLDVNNVFITAVKVGDVDVVKIFLESKRDDLNIDQAITETDKEEIVNLLRPPLVIHRQSL